MSLIITVRSRRLSLSVIRATSTAGAPDFIFVCSHQTRKSPSKLRSNTLPNFDLIETYFILCPTSTLDMSAICARNMFLIDVKQATAASAGEEGTVDFGASRLSLVPALDSYEDAMWSDIKSVSAKISQTTV